MNLFKKFHYWTGRKRVNKLTADYVAVLLKTWDFDKHAEYASLVSRARCVANMTVKFERDETDNDENGDISYI